LARHYTKVLKLTAYRCRATPSKSIPMPATSSIDTLRAKASDVFQQQYDAKPTVFAVSPGRVNLIGEHIDYCDGFVLPFAIDRHLLIAARPAKEPVATLFAEFGGESVRIPLDPPFDVEAPSWSHYLRGAFHHFREATSLPLPGFDAVIVSDIPIGAGLSSSAALEIAILTLLEHLADHTLPAATKALLGQKAENSHAGVPCGIMDQFAVTFGRRDHLVLIDCRSQEVELVPFPFPDIVFVVTHCGVSHQLADGAYAQRRQQVAEALAIMGKDSWRDVTTDDLNILDHSSAAANEVLYRRARHVVGEIERVRQTVDALRSSDLARLPALLAASHQSLRDDYEVSCDELDLLVELADSSQYHADLFGSRMTGGGFGGSTITLCHRRSAEAFADELASRYKAATTIDPILFITRPSDGAHLLHEPG